MCWLPGMRRKEKVSWVEHGKKRKQEVCKIKKIYTDPYTKSSQHSIGGKSL